MLQHAEWMRCKLDAPHTLEEQDSLKGSSSLYIICLGLRIYIVDMGNIIDSRISNLYQVNVVLFF